MNTMIVHTITFSLINARPIGNVNKMMRPCPLPIRISCRIAIIIKNGIRPGRHRSETPIPMPGNQLFHPSWCVVIQMALSKPSNESMRLESPSINENKRCCENKAKSNEFGGHPSNFQVAYGFEKRIDFIFPWEKLNLMPNSQLRNREILSRDIISQESNSIAVLCDI